MAEIEVTVGEALARLDELLDRVRAGDSATMAPAVQWPGWALGSSRFRRPERLQSWTWIAPDFNETPEEDIELMEGGSPPLG